MPEYTIKPENTAIKLGSSKSTTVLLQEATPNDVCLDFGCGLLRNAEKILPKVKQLDLYDSKLQMDKHADKIDKYGDVYHIEDNNIPEDKYDKILCSFVINVIQDKKIRKEVIKTIFKALKVHGKCYLEVRTDDFVSILKHYEKDEVNGGYIIGKGKTRTYQMPYTYEQLETFIRETDVPGRIIRKIPSSGSIVVVIEKYK